MIINFITDKDNKDLLRECDELFEDLGIKYNSGNYRKNIVHYMEFRCEPASINIFYGYINNLLTEYSNNNIFVYKQTYFHNNWIAQLDNYDKIITLDESDKIIEHFINREVVYLGSRSENNKYYKNIISFTRTLKTLKLPYEMKLLEDNDLPEISVCIITYNRRKFMKLLSYNMTNSTYPSNKIEYIIIDDGEDSMKELLPNDKNIKYYRYEDKKTIGWKRNESVKLSSKGIICIMDDDDFYPMNSLKRRVSCLLNSKKQCVYCSTIGCFNINKYYSIVNVNPINYPMEKKVSEATLAFKREFWLNGKFNNDDDYNEGEYFIKEQTSLCKEIGWEGVIVSLLHSRNTVQQHNFNDEPNGSYFNFTDDEFNMITNL